MAQSLAGAGQETHSFGHGHGTGTHVIGDGTRPVAVDCDGDRAVGTLHNPCRAGWRRRRFPIWTGPEWRTKRDCLVAITPHAGSYPIRSSRHAQPTTPLTSPSLKAFGQAAAIRVPIAGSTLAGSNATRLRPYGRCDTRVVKRDTL